MNPSSNLKILIIHTKYDQAGGEDTVVNQEHILLGKKYVVELLYFQNKTGFKGALQFLFSIWNVKSARRVRTKIKDFKPDVVHLHNFHFASGPLIIRAIKKMGVPLVQTIHNYRLLCPSAILLHNNQLFLDSLQQKFPWSAVMNKVYRNSRLLTFWIAFIYWFHKKINTFNKVDTYLCLTEFSKNLLQQASLNIPADRFKTKPNFTIANIRTDSYIRGQHFLFIGRLSSEKGIEILLKAFENSTTKLKIAGDGPLKNIVQEKAKKNSNIIYLGAIPSQEVKRELSMAQALVFPSIWYEGMPMTILEAFSNKTPIIASNLGAMSTMIINDVNGLHFEAGNSNALKTKIDQWSNFTKIEKETMQNNAFINYQQLYSEEQQMSYFNEIYNTVIKSES